MLFQAIKRYYFTAELWELKVNPNTGGVESENYLGTANIGIGGDRTDFLTIDSEQPLGKGTVLRDIRDRNDNLIYPDRATNTGISYTIAYEQPTLNLYGELEGYHATARRTVVA
jgi:hypothetical protein